MVLAISWNAKKSGFRERSRGNTVLRTYSDAGEFSFTEKNGR